MGRSRIVEEILPNVQRLQIPGGYFSPSLTDCVSTNPFVFVGVHQSFSALMWEYKSAYEECQHTLAKVRREFLEDSSNGIVLTPAIP